MLTRALNARLQRRGLSTGNVIIIVAIVVFLLMLMCVGLGLAFILPSLGVAREAANTVKSGTQLRQIEMSREVYARQFADETQRPSAITFNMLIDEGYMTAELINSPFGPVPDNGGDYWLNPRPELDEPQSPALGDNRTIASYDRAMYANANAVSYAYFGGEIAVVPHEEFDRLLAQPANSGIDFNLPARRR